MLARKTRIICTIGDMRKLYPRGPNYSDSQYRDATKKQLRDEIRAFMNAGMNVARINMAHFDLDQKGNSPYSDRDYLRDLIQAVREAREDMGRTVAIMGDIQGPKVRVAGIETEIELKPGSKSENATKVAFIKNGFLKNASWDNAKEYVRVGVIHQGNFDFVQNVKRNHLNKRKPREIHIGETGPKLKVIGFIPDYKGILCETIEGGKIKNRDGVSVKNSKIEPSDYILDDYEKDRHDLEFLLNDTSNDGHKVLVDVVALSFVKSNVDTNNLQTFIKRIVPPGEIIKKYGTQEFPIISKIESKEGVDDIRRGEGIIEGSYAVMVARGDLGLYCRIQEVAKYQKEIIARCRRREKPAIVATEMLDRMIEHADPSRAEATDVFNAVCDGADALMLSGETAKGNYRRQSVEMMDAIIKVAEKHMEEQKDYESRISQLQRRIIEQFSDQWRSVKKLSNTKQEIDFRNKKSDLEIREDAHHIAYCACVQAFQLGCSAIIVITESGEMARLIARYRPETRLIAGVCSQQVANILALSYGVEPLVIERANTVDDQFLQFQKIIAQEGLPKEPPWLSRRVITIASSPVERSRTTSYLHVLHY